MAEKRKYKRPKSYYIKSANKKFRKSGNELDADMKGFLITCNRNEFECRKDAYQLLNEYADKLYGPIQDDKKDESGEEDFDLALKKEVADLKEKRKWRFNAMKTGTNSVLFISAEIENPCELAHHILTDLQQTKKLKSRTILRLLPITGTCKTYEDKMEKLAEEVVAPHFEFSCKTYMYVVKIRSNNAVSRGSIIKILDTVIRRNEDLNHQVNMDDPDLVILIEVIRNICCFSVIKDYKKFKKYNLHSIVEEPKKEKKDEVEDKTEGNNCSQGEEKGPAIESTPAEMETSTAIHEPVEVKETDEHSKTALNVAGEDLNEPEADKNASMSVKVTDDCVDDVCNHPEATGDDSKQPDGHKIDDTVGDESKPPEGDAVVL
ncbi:THUMP domain-containing protein 1-like [Anneissia japonica]|uniref:THUMP domain-containing protein 1-like n=1 Tax=Anneissia japonica TaxID=1529436 RepID=UPI001425725D|nr:THUMP domain-containing protein 1-like [Anneissia japonica]XP_033117816.1 THUMP domain-containing protein 1-like [Anneissia japonica]